MPTTHAVIDRMDFGYVPEFVIVGTGSARTIEAVQPETFSRWGEIEPALVWGEPTELPVSIYSARTTSGRLVRSDWGTCEFLGPDHGIVSMRRR